MTETTSDSWETYERELERTTSKLLYKLLGPFRGLIYSDIAADAASAESNRAEAEQRFEDLHGTATDSVMKLRDLAYTPTRQGEPLPETARNAHEDLEETLNDIDALLTTSERFLTVAEQTKLRRVKTDGEELNETIAAKLGFDDEIDGIETAVNDARDSFTTHTPGDPDTPDPSDALLPNDIERELIEDIEQIQCRIQAARDDYADAVRDADLTRLERLDDATDTLHDRVTTYNETIVTEQAETVLANGHDLVEDITDLRDYYSNGEHAGDASDATPGSDEYTDRIDEQLTAINNLLSTNQRKHIESSITSDLNSMRNDLEEHREFIVTRVQFSETLTDIENSVATLHGTINDELDDDTYLTSRRENRLKKRCHALYNELEEIVDTVTADTISNDNQATINDLGQALQDLHSRVDTYNEQYIEAKREEYADVFTGIGDDNLSLNEQQEAAVFRNDIHNQINAGAGTGKTFCVACREKYLVDQGVKEQDIIALTFLKQAVGEMEDRAADLFGLTDIETRTLHSFGKEILDETDPTGVQIEGQSRLREVTRLIRHLRENNDAFSTHYNTFEGLYKDKHFDHDEDTQKQFIESQEQKSTVTLCGEDIQSRHDEIQEAHRTIADWLFEHDITYRYQQYAAWADNPGQEAYIPDFTLPNRDVNIEYVPSEETQRQQQQYEQKRSAGEIMELHTDTDHTAITISGDDVQHGSIGAAIEREFSMNGLPTGRKLSKEDRRKKAYRANKITRDIEAEFAEFVKKAKTNQINPGLHFDELDEEEDPELYYFSVAATELLDAYNDWYDTLNAYDFVDMIVTATEAINAGEVDHIASFEHVIVDEFQDLNLVQIEFVKALLSRRDDSRLFAVGDDWQSIYGFKGARPDYFVDFDQYFDPATETRLETNYRCTDRVVRAGNALIEHNDSKTDKTVRAIDESETTPTVHRVPGSTTFQYEENAVERIVQLADESVQQHGRDPGEVMVLARNREGSNFLRSIAAELSRRGIPVGGSDGVQVSTAHQTKGSEAEHVIIANAAAGMRDGFPPEERERSLTELVELDTGSRMDEERRLFYVAVTRAEERLDIQTRTGQESPFIREISTETAEKTVGIDCSQDRVTVRVIVERARESESYWSTRQLGTLRTGDGFEMQFAVLDDTDVPLLDESGQYHLENAKIGEHEGDPQVQIDPETVVKRM